MKTKEKDLVVTDAQVEFLKSVIEFAQLITTERGKVLEYTLNRLHTNTVTNTVRELRGFGGFSFRTDIGQTKKMGIDRIKIWYCPNRRSARSGEPLVLVLDVYWQGDLANCKLDKFNSDPTWQRKILKVIQDEKKRQAEQRQLAKTAKRRHVF